MTAGFDRISVELREQRKEISGLRSEISGLRSEISGLRSEITGLRSEFRQELRQEIGGLRAEMRQEAVATRIATVQVGGALMAAILGLIAAVLLKL
ncbi:MAG: hypothetical protein EXQ70_11525 [Solirubrobacterales bacterium]|nr:hypothetical protein [Solirubrobacterales bacterium]